MPVSIFPCFRVSQKMKIKQSPINLKLHGTYCWIRSNHGDLESMSRKLRGGHEVGGAHTPLRRTLHPRGPLMAPLTYLFHPFIPTYPKTIEEHNRSGVPPPEASVATENQSRPVPAPCWRGDPSPMAISIIPALSMTRRE